MSEEVKLRPLKNGPRLRTPTTPRTHVRNYSVLPLFSLVNGCEQRCLYCPYAYSTPGRPHMPPFEDWAIFPWKHSLFDYPNMSAQYILEVLRRHGDIIVFATPCMELEQFLTYLERRNKYAKERVHLFCKINTLDPILSKWLEPRFPVPNKRINIVRLLLERGWDIYVIALPNLLLMGEMQRLIKLFGTRVIFFPRPKYLLEIDRFRASPLYMSLKKRVQTKIDYLSLHIAKGWRRFSKFNTLYKVETREFVEVIQKVVHEGLRDNSG